jgi:kynurenine formamidase
MLVDLSHPIEHGMAVFPGLDPPQVRAVADHEASRVRYEGKAEFHLGAIDMAFNTGTYVDSPFHRYREREDVAALTLARLVSLPGIVLEPAALDGRAAHVDAAGDDLRGHAVLVRTGWDLHWGTDAYWQPPPFLASSSVDLLLDGGAALVGIDSWNVDDVRDPSRPAHTRLLAAGVPIVENLCGLGALPRLGFRFSAPALAVVGGASFPVRAYAELAAP